MSLLRVGLCFSRACFFLRSGATRVGWGDPICSRATAFTALLARNMSRFFFRGKPDSPIQISLNHPIMQ